MGEQIMAGYMGLLIGVHIAGAVILFAGAIQVVAELRRHQPTDEEGSE